MALDIVKLSLYIYIQLDLIQLDLIGNIKIRRPLCALTRMKQVVCEAPALNIAIVKYQLYLQL